MDKIEIYDVAGEKLLGSFDRDTAQVFAEKSTGYKFQKDQYEHEELYRTVLGQWMLREWSTGRKSYDFYAPISDDQARRWLLDNHLYDEVNGFFEPPIQTKSGGVMEAWAWKDDEIGDGQMIAVRIHAFGKGAHVRYKGFPESNVAAVHKDSSVTRNHTPAKEVFFALDIDHAKRFASLLQDIVETPKPARGIVFPGTYCTTPARAIPLAPIEGAKKLAPA